MSRDTPNPKNVNDGSYLSPIDEVVQLRWTV